MPYYRYLVIEGLQGEWRFHVGETYVKIVAPNSKIYEPTISEVTGESWDSIERAQWKGYWKGVKPQQVKDWILTHHNI